MNRRFVGRIDDSDVSDDRSMYGSVLLGRIDDSDVSDDRFFLAGSTIRTDVSDETTQVCKPVVRKGRKAATEGFFFVWRKP